MVNSQDLLGFSIEMKELRTAYLEALPEKNRLVQHAWNALEADHWDVEAYKTVYRLVHNLAGAAGTYGLISISHQAHNTLQLMKPWLGAGAGPAEDAQLQITQHIAVMQQKTDSVIAAKN